MMKSMGEGLAQIEDAEDLKPVLIGIDGGWQIGYLLETLENGWVAVFVPQAPTPTAGNVIYLPAERIKPTGYLDAAGPVDREAYRHRIWRGASRHQPHTLRRLSKAATECGAD